LHWQSEDFQEQWRGVSNRSIDASSETERVVAKIIADVRESGDKALRQYTEQFDGRKAEQGSYEIPAQRVQAAWEKCSPEVQSALTISAERIRKFHEPQLAKGYRQVGESGQGELALRVSALDRVGLYVPGGTALYPSSVLMTAIPAQVAGVREIIMVTPGASDETLAAAKVAGVHRVFEIGGAQAVAALAFGTKTVPRVDKIVGPGNQWVAAAKRQVFGQVDIDSVAGPSEVLIIADEAANPRFVAADMLAQAEHDTEARAILVSTSESLLNRVDKELEAQLQTMTRSTIAHASLASYGVGVLVDSLERAIDLSNDYAPEHLELALENAQALIEGVKHAGAIFVGHYSPEAAGDYSAGPNHVLPTGGAARFASPLGVYDFQKFTSILSMSKEGLQSLAAPIQTLARVEGLQAHGRSVALRFADDAAESKSSDE
jgi:histidinol dehydrogenase